MVHFYGEISARELYDLCEQGLTDIEALLDVIIAWLREHPQMLDRSL